ncbi:MAG: HU family DNA-binding protein, partial [Tannerella sp.]|nr:HU family DNA-binding protein [Tannerella sp.]
MDEKFSLDEIAVILSEKTGKSADETRKFLRELIILMNDAITTEQIVKVKGIGTFKIIVIKERESVHVNTGERIVIPAHHKLSFTPDKSLKELINKPFSFFEAIEAKEGGSGITEAVITAEDDEEEDDLTPDEKSEADEINAEIREILHNDAPAPVSPPPPPSFSEEGPGSLPPLKFVVDQEIEAPAEEIQPEDNPLDTPDTDSANEPEISKIEDVAPAEDRPVPPPPPYSEEWRKRQQVPPPPPPVRNQVIQAPVEKIQPETNPLETFDSGDIGEYHVAIVEDVAPAEEHPVPPPPPPSVIDQEVQASLEEIHPEAIIVDTSDADDAGEQAVIVEDVDPAEEHPVPPPPPPSVIDQELQAPVEEIQPEVITSDTSDSGNANEQDING